MSPFTFFFTLLAILLVPHCSSFNPKLLNASIEQFSPNWASGGATWYGAPEGFGSDGAYDPSLINIDINIIYLITLLYYICIFSFFFFSRWSLWIWKNCGTISILINGECGWTFCIQKWRRMWNLF